LHVLWLKKKVLLSGQGIGLRSNILSLPRSYLIEDQYPAHLTGLFFLIKVHANSICVCSFFVICFLLCFCFFKISLENLLAIALMS
jgi:hypothetical protein